MLNDGRVVRSRVADGGGEAAALRQRGIQRESCVPESLLDVYTTTCFFQRFILQRWLFCAVESLAMLICCARFSSSPTVPDSVANLASSGSRNGPPMIPPGAELGRGGALTCARPATAEFVAVSCCRP